MWAFMLTTEAGEEIYYDPDELQIAILDRVQYGGVITDRKGREIT